MLNKTLLEDEQWRVRVGLSGRYTVTLIPNQRVKRATRAEGHHFIRTLECAADLGYDVAPGRPAFDVLVRDFADAVMDDGEVAWQTFFLTAPHEIANVCMR